VKLHHRARREQDEFVCTRCGKRWAVDEDEPECLGLGELNKAAPIVKRMPHNPQAVHI